MKKIDVSTPKHPSTFALVDSDDYVRASQGPKWTAEKTLNTMYAMRKISVKGKSKTQYLHRYVLDAKKGNKVDHRDGDGLNCQRSNLRYYKKGQNQYNQRKMGRNASSQYKGVCWCNTLRKWMACITFNYKQIFLGYFCDEIDAAKAYNKKARELFGKFACPNFR